MKNLKNKREGATKVSRITRSISFVPTLFAYVTARAKAENRSFNWIVNDLIRQDTEKG